MKMPDRIWAWLFHESAVIDEMQGGWTDKPDKREVEYIRSDLVVGEWNAAIEAAAEKFDWWEVGSRQRILALRKGGAA